MRARPADSGPAIPATPASIPANDRLKEGFRSWLWSSVIAATVLHFATFAPWPTLTAADIDVRSEIFEVLDIPDEIEIPPPPPQLTRPATPVMAAIDVDETITIGRTTLEANPPEALAPPPDEPVEAQAGSRISPFTVAPTILNSDEIVRAMERAYPTFLRDAGIGGTVTVLFHIDEEGEVQEVRLDAGSGQDALDRAALSVASLYRFSPALNGDRRVAVWVSFPITFRVRE